MTGYKNDHVLPVKNLRSISVIGAAKLYKLDSKTLQDMVRSADVFLPDWDIMGIRNKMAYTGVCAGLVAPQSPINPVSEEQRSEFEAEDEERKNPVQIMGSLVRLTACVTNPVIPKDELEAYTLRLTYNACNSGEISSSSLPAIQTDAKNLAIERLVNKAPIAVQFYDIILDYESETILTDATGKNYPHIMNLIRNIMEGRNSSNEIAILSGGEEASVPKKEPKKEGEVVPYGMYTAGYVFKNDSGKDINLELFKQGQFFAGITKIFGEDESFRSKIGYDQDFIGSEPFLTRATRGAVMLLGLAEEWQQYSSKFKSKILKKFPDEKGYASKLAEVADYITAAADTSDMYPDLRKAIVKEPGKASFHIPFGFEASEENSLHAGAKKSMFGILFRSCTGLSESEIQKVGIEFAASEFDVQAEITGSKAQLTTVSPASKDSRLVPMKIGIEYIDLVDKVRNTVMIFKEVGAALRQTSELAYIFDFVMTEMFLIVPYKEG